MGANSGMVAAGFGIRAAGAQQQAVAQRSSLNYQASVAQNNAIIAQDEATVAQNNGAAAVQTQQMKTASLMSTQRANMAANGVDLGEGSPLDVLASTEIMGQHDAQTIQQNAMYQAWGYKTQAADDTANANALTAMGKAVSPTLSAATSLLSSATMVNPAWKSYSAATKG